MLRNLGIILVCLAVLCQGDVAPKTTFLTMSTPPALPTSTPPVDIHDLKRQAIHSSVNQAALTSLIPSPTRNWVGIRRPNYDTMYTQFTIDLHCDGKSVGMDYGVYGFYTWIEHLVVIAGNIWTAFAAEKNSHGRFKFWQVTNGLLGFAFCMIRGGFLVKDLSNCHDEVDSVLGSPGVYPTTPVIIYTCVSIPGWGLAGLGALFVSLNSPKGYAAALPCFALFYTFFSNAMFYYSYTNFLYIDKNIFKPILAVSMPLLVVVLFFLISPCINGRFWPGVLFIFVGCMLCFHMWAVGMGRILLGRTANDVWGAYALQSAINIAQLILGIVFAPLSVITAGLASGGG